MITKCPWPDLFAVVGTDAYCKSLAALLRRAGWSSTEIERELIEVRAAMEDTDEQSFAV